MQEASDLAAALARYRRKRNCYLCGEAIDFTLRWPNPKSPSEDHVLPKAVFGEGPKRWTHLHCNQRKGTKLVVRLPPTRVRDVRMP
jgi:hypothetical protein